jgi:hypothetical protein
MRTDGRTDMTKLVVAFCNFANAPRKLMKHRRRIRRREHIVSIVVLVSYRACPSVRLETALPISIKFADADS